MSEDAGDGWYPEHARASDADRATVSEQLRRALSDGRITLTEFDDRLAATYQARTYGDLAVLTGDLPATVTALPAPTSGQWAPASGPSPHELTRSYLRRHVLQWLGGAMIITIVASLFTVSSDIDDYSWVPAVLLFWAGLIAARISTGTHYDRERRRLERLGK
jgi:hypothetical protein